jgi:hypothetical protein
MVEREEAAIVVYAPDGGAEAFAERLGSILGFPADLLEQRDTRTLCQMLRMFRDRRIVLAPEHDETWTLKEIVAAFRPVFPDLPHVLVVDSVQEAIAHVDCFDYDESKRSMEAMRAGMAFANDPHPSLFLATSQVVKGAFAGRTRDTISPLAAGLNTGKIAFLATLGVNLSGDPDVAPEFAYARVMKNKHKGGKPGFAYQLTPDKSRLREMDVVEVVQRKDESALRRQTEKLLKLAEEIAPHIDKAPGITTNGICDLVSARKADVKAALSGLEAQGRYHWKPGARSANHWHPGRKSS